MLARVEGEVQGLTRRRRQQKRVDRWRMGDRKRSSWKAGDDIGLDEEEERILLSKVTEELSGSQKSYAAGWWLDQKS